MLATVSFMLTIQSELDYEQSEHAQESMRCGHDPAAELIDGVGGLAGDVLDLVTVVRLRHRFVVKIRLDSDVANFSGCLLDKRMVCIRFSVANIFTFYSKCFVLFCFVSSYPAELFVMLYERWAFGMRTKDMSHFVFCWRRVGGAGEQNDHCEHEHLVFFLFFCSKRFLLA